MTIIDPKSGKPIQSESKADELKMIRLALETLNNKINQVGMVQTQTGLLLEFLLLNSLSLEVDETGKHIPCGELTDKFEVFADERMKQFSAQAAQAKSGAVSLDE